MNDTQRPHPSILGMLEQVHWDLLNEHPNNSAAILARCDQEATAVRNVLGGRLHQQVAHIGPSLAQQKATVDAMLPDGDNPADCCDEHRQAAEEIRFNFQILCSALHLALVADARS